MRAIDYHTANVTLAEHSFIVPRYVTLQAVASLLATRSGFAPELLW